MYDLTFQFDFDATKAALLYLACKDFALDKYKACKLLFLADREHLLRFGRPITGDSYNALPHGPTPARTHTLLDRVESVLVNGEDIPPQNPEIEAMLRALQLDVTHEHPRYLACETADLDALAETDILVLDDIARQYGKKTFKELWTLTHGMKAYANVWRDDAARRRFPMRFEDFFAEAPDKAGFLQEIKENMALQEALK